MGELCGVPGLRFRSVAGFPFGWFYFVAADHVDVVRLLAEARLRTCPPSSATERQ
jgi:hypothetical protein